MSPTLLGHLNTPGSSLHLDVTGNLAYISYVQNEAKWGLQIIDVSNPISPTLRGNYDLGVAYAEHSLGNVVKVASNRAYVSLWGKGVQIIDVSKPISPTLLGHFDTSANVTDIEIVDNLAYIAEQWGAGERGQLQIFDVHNPSRPILLSSYVTRQEAFSVDVVSNLY